MKKSFLVLSTAFVALAFASCSNSSKPAEENNADSTMLATDSITSIDTIEMRDPETGATTDTVVSSQVPANK